MAELDKSMKSLKQDQDQVFRFNFEDPAIAQDQTEDHKSKYQNDTLVDQPEPESDDDELETEIEKLEQRKAVLQREGKK